MNKLKKIGIGVVVLGALAGITDVVVDPYTDTPDTYVITDLSSDGSENKIELAKASPDITLSKEDGVVAWQISYPFAVPAEKPLLSDKIEYGNLVTYPLKADVGAEDGGLMMEFTLPDPTPVSLPIDGIDDFRWLYQTAENRADPDEVYPELAPEQEGSYAVYNSKGVKLFHIYRPLVTDATGGESYGKLDMTIRGHSKTLSVIPNPLIKYPAIIKVKFAMTSIPLANEIYHE